MKIHAVEAELSHADRRTDRRTDRRADITKLMVAFRAVHNDYRENAKIYFL